MKSLSFSKPAQNRTDNLTLIIIVATLLIFGLVMVYDSSTIMSLKDFNDSYYYIRQQSIWVVLGIIAAAFFSFFDYRILKRFAFPMLLTSLGLLIAVFIPTLGVSGGGAHRWLNLGFVTIQPAEIIKLTGAIYLASLLEKQKKLIPFIIVVGLVTFITAVLQKDLGSTAVFVLMAIAMYFTSGAPLVHFLVFIPMTLLVFLGLTFSSSYRLQRVLAFLNPFSDTQGFSYHISQVLLALGSGGFLGVGLGQSRQKLEYIPEVTTDSIFAVIGEELGFLGSIILIMLFVALILKGFKIAQNCSDAFGKNLAIGLISWLGIQIVVNLSSMIALLPLTGVPLPFISYGGSALVANMTAIGILLNISKQNK